MIFAATAQQTIALIVFISAFIGAALYLAGTSRKAKPEVGSEIELAPNRKPYLDDEELEGPRLEKVLLWGVLSLMVIGVGLPLYWITEPNRQAGAIDYFDERLAGQTYHHGQPVGGGALFAPTADGGFNCAGCHGGQQALGDVVPYTLTDPITDEVRQVQWRAPALDTATLKWTDAQLKDILVYGRTFSPMPAWGIDGGGPMNEQQIDNLIRYLHKLARDAGYENENGLPIPEAVREASTDAADAELERLRGLEDALEEAEAAVDDATDDAAREAAEAVVARIEAEIELNQPTTLGAALFNLNCARCHTKGWSYGEPTEAGGGAMGPNLTNVEQQFPNEEDHIDFVTNGRLKGERYGENGQFDGSMPYFLNILSEEEIAAIVDYERSLRQDS